MKAFIQYCPIWLSILLGTTTFLSCKKEPATAEVAPGENKAKILPALTEKQKTKIVANLPATSTAQAKKPRKILVFWRCEGFVHKSITFGNYAITEMGNRTKAYTTDLAESYEVFSEENLDQYDAIFFNNTTRLKPKASHQKAILNFLSKGKGVVGAHAATDNFYKWEEGIKMMGGLFKSHPWNHKGTWVFQLDDPKHPINKVFQEKGFWHQDEIYQYQEEKYPDPNKLRYLQSLNLSESKNFKQVKKELDTMPHVPVTWIQNYEGGRVFYSNLGHRPETFQNKNILQMYLDGIQYALGDLKVDDSPTFTSSKSN